MFQYNRDRSPRWHRSTPADTFPSTYEFQYGPSASQSEQTPSFSAQPMPRLTAWGWPIGFHNHLNWPWSDPGSLSFQPYLDFSGNDAVPSFLGENPRNRIRGCHDTFMEYDGFLGQTRDLPRRFSEAFPDTGRTVTGTVEEVDQSEETQDHRSDTRSDQVEISSVSTVEEDDTSSHSCRFEVSASSSSEASNDGTTRVRYRTSYPQPVPNDCCCCCSTRCKSCPQSRCPRPGESDAETSRQSDVDAIRDLSQELKEEATNVKHERQSFQRLNRELKTILEKLENDLPRIAERSSRSSHLDNNGPPSWNDVGSHPYRNIRPSNIRWYSLDAVEAVFRRYDMAWRSILNSRENLRRAIQDLTLGYPRSIPWPSPDLRMSSLSKTLLWYSEDRPFSDDRMDSRYLPPEIADSVFHLQQWNVFCFFVYAFRLVPYYDHDHPLRFCIDARRSRTGRNVPRTIQERRLLALRAQLMHERWKWNPRHLDSAGYHHVRFYGGRDDVIGDAVRAVWEGVPRALKACDTSLDQLGHMRMWM
ncbi:hypothetical protein DTO271G3_2245 [Paecilomyces variotii]|nr:hypothetical protein DTO271G3_2245 [Paecilomyces variotii]